MNYRIQLRAPQSSVRIAAFEKHCKYALDTLPYFSHIILKECVFQKRIEIDHKSTPFSQLWKHSFNH